MVRVATPAVAAVSSCVADRDVAPGQGVEGVEQAGLVVLGRQDEISAAPAHIVRRGTLAMKSIRRHDGLVQVQAIEQRDDHRDLVRLRAHLDLAGDHASLAGQGGQQMHLAAVGVLCAADGLAVHPDGDQRRLVITALTGAGEIPGGAGPVHQPGAGHRV